MSAIEEEQREAKDLVDGFVAECERRFEDEGREDLGAKEKYTKKKKRRVMKKVLGMSELILRNALV